MTHVISRGAAERARLVARWPAPIPSGATLACGEDEYAAFVRHGAVLGMLGPGQHVLRVDCVPFLALAVGPELDAELWFVSRGRRAVGVQGSFAGLRCSRSGLVLSGVLDGSAEVLVSDSRALLAGLLRGAGVAADPGALMARAAHEELRRAADAREIEPTALIGLSSVSWPNAPRLHAAIAAALAPYGVAAHAVSLRLSPDAASQAALGGVAAPAVVDLNQQAERLRRFRAALQPGFRVNASDASGNVYAGTVVSVQHRSCLVQWDGAGTTQIESGRLVPVEARSDGPVLRVAAEAPSTTLPSATGQAEAAVAIAGSLAAGTRVLVQHADGRSYLAVVQQFQQGWYEVAWENGARAWVPPQAVRRA